jgi:hypothetical protein
MGTSTGNWPDIKRQVTSISRDNLANSESVSRTLGNYVREHMGGSFSNTYNAQAANAGSRLGGFLAGVQQRGLTESLIETGRPGLEPRTTEPESVVLPIKLSPIG